MSKSFYFDTSIWIDIYCKRGINGEFAKRLLEKIIVNDYTIFYSDAIVAELKKLDFSENEIKTILGIVEPCKIRRIHIFKEEMLRARKLSKQRRVPWRDAMHILLAKDNCAEFVSRDKDFERLKDIAIT